MRNAMFLPAFREGHVVCGSQEQADGSFLIELAEDPDVPARCGAWCEPCTLVHGRNWRQMLRNRDNLDAGQAVRLDELLSANAPLATVYLLKTALKELWFAPTIREGRKRWREWFRLALDSGLAPAIQFAKRLRKCLRGILASAIFPMSTSILEGVNNKIKVNKRTAYANAQIGLALFRYELPLRPIM